MRPQERFDDGPKDRRRPGKYGSTRWCVHTLAVGGDAKGARGTAWILGDFDFMDRRVTRVEALRSGARNAMAEVVVTVGRQLEQPREAEHRRHH